MPAELPRIPSEHPYLLSLSEQDRQELPRSLRLPPSAGSRRHLSQPLSAAAEPPAALSPLEFAFRGARWAPHSRPPLGKGSSACGIRHRGALHRYQGQLLRRGLPRDCIHPTPDEPDYDGVEQLYIDPDECIDCDACVEACPVDACFAEDQLPEEWSKYTEINLGYYKSKG